MYKNKIIVGDNRITLKDVPDGIADMCVTSPPYYGLRNYNHDSQIGLEETPEQYVEQLVQVFREVKRILKPEGTLWLNLGDSYAGGGGASGHNETTKNLGAKTSSYGAVKSGGKTYGLKPKDLIGIPWAVAFALRADGWYLRQDIIWQKPNPMPESVTDRCTKAHEYIFLLSKSKHYYYDAEAIQEPANYDGRKDTMMKGSEKYANGYFPTDINRQSLAVKAHERWRANKEGVLIRNKRSVWEQKEDDNYNAWQWLFQNASEDVILPLWQKYIDDQSQKNSVWKVTTKPFYGAHFATFPEELIEPCIKAGCPEGGLILDPFGGAGTTGLVARKLNRNYLLCELNDQYVDLTKKRISNELGMFE